ncbi:MAG: PAS domain-containing protein [Planctomycetes bacterium]|nr:PAS domain-containing protein [Planctomycetota bacterium]
MELDRAARGRLRWVHAARPLVAAAGIAALAAEGRPLRSDPAQAALIAAAALDLLYVLVARSIRDHANLARLEIALDLLLVSALAYFTGGVQSVFAYLYFANVLAAIAVVSPRAGLACASGATVLLSAITVAYFWAGDRRESLPLVSPDQLRGSYNQLGFALPYLFFFSLSLHLVAALAGRLVAELRRARIFTDEILANVSAGVITADRDGRVVYANRQARGLLGLSDSPVERRPVAEVLPESVHAPVRAALEREEETEEEAEFRAGGRVTHVRITSSVLRDPDGTRRGNTVILTDVSLQKEMEETIRWAERLQHLSQLAASMAHEIRNPLASIRGAIQELGEAEKMTDDDRKLMSIILKESSRLNELITNFLEFARERPPVLTRCDVVPVLQEVVTLLRQREDSKTVSVELDAPRDLVCLADAVQLKQVFLNLGVNAMQATRRGTTVRIRAYPATPPDGRRSQPGIAVDVVDEGEGIPTEAMDYLGNPFFTTKQGGTGMGLAIAGKIIQAHRGRLIVDSTQGKGSRFSVWLPAAA